MKNTDLFKAIDNIDLKYVEKAWGDFAEVNTEVAPITVQPAKKSPMRVFGGAAACVGVIGVAAAAVIIATGSGNMGIASNQSENGINITVAAESEDIFEILKIDYNEKNCEKNWELLRVGNEGLSDKDPMQAVKNELEKFKETCISFELKDIYFDEEKGKTFSQAVSNIKAAYNITDGSRITFISADINAKLDKSEYSYEYMTGRSYLLIRDDEGIWYIWSVNEETDRAAFEEISPLWQQLREEQKDITSTEILTAAQNYITACFGDKEGFVIDRIKYFDADSFDSLQPDKEKAKDYGIILDDSDSTFTKCSIIPVEAIYHFKSDEGNTACYFEVYNMIKDSKGNWYIPKDLQVSDHNKAWTWEEQWEKAKANTLYPSENMQETMLETAKKQAEEYRQGDNIVSFALKGISVNEKRDRDIYLYGYGIEDLDRVSIIAAEYDVNDSIKNIVYTLIQDEEGLWYIKDSLAAKDYPNYPNYPKS